MRDQVDAMDAASYFALFAQLLKTNPPAAADAPMVARCATGAYGGADLGVSHESFRSTFRDWAAEHTAYPHDLAEMALAHALENAPCGAF